MAPLSKIRMVPPNISLLFRVFWPVCVFPFLVFLPCSSFFCVSFPCFALHSISWLGPYLANLLSFWGALSGKLECFLGIWVPNFLSRAKRRGAMPHQRCLQRFQFISPNGPPCLVRMAPQTCKLQFADFRAPFEPSMGPHLDLWIGNLWIGTFIRPSHRCRTVPGSRKPQRNSQKGPTTPRLFIRQSRSWVPWAHWEEWALWGDNP